MRAFLATALLPFLAGVAIAAAPQPGKSAAAPRVRVAAACFDLGSVQRSQSPEDLWPVVVKCIGGGELDKAVRVSAAASVYAKFDTFRVIDTTAHQAVNALPATYLGSLPAEQVERFMGRMQAYGAGSAPHAAICASLAKIGPPDYFPVYMIQNGMDATNKPNGSALKQGFQAAPAWKASLVDYLHCPAA